METYALITAATKDEAIVYKIDFSQGIEQAIVSDKITFHSKYFGYDENQHSVMKYHELYFFYDPENLVKIDGKSFEVIKMKRVQIEQEE